MASTMMNCKSDAFLIAAGLALLSECRFRKQAASDEYLLNMENTEVEEVLTSMGWEKLLRKEHLMLFRKYDETLQVYSYKSMCWVSWLMNSSFSVSSSWKLQ